MKKSNVPDRSFPLVQHVLRGLFLKRVPVGMLATLYRNHLVAMHDIARLRIIDEDHAPIFERRRYLHSSASRHHPSSSKKFGDAQYACVRVGDADLVPNAGAIVSELRDVEQTCVPHLLCIPSCYDHRVREGIGIVSRNGA